MTATRIGSLCSGYRGLDMAVEEVLGGTTAWVSDIDPGASRILAHHWPDVPNLGDLTAVDWQQVVDTFGRPRIVCGGYPCQPFSNAGKRLGVKDERHIWPHIARALGVLRPRVAIFENVAGHLRLGFDTVLADLAGLGFDVEWCVVRASEVGAPHRRGRLFILAVAADAADLGHEWTRRARDGRAGSPDSPQPVADTAGISHPNRPIGDHRVQLVTEPGAGSGDRPRDHSAGTGGDRSAPVVGWGRYGPAVRRWEALLGRPAPWPDHPAGGLNPPFLEWMHGLPEGHVTNPLIWEGWRPKAAQNAQLKALGNGVVPRQATAALRLLMDRALGAAA